ncbi:hypothetical protein BDR22DRAFT_815669 [Usnea florida]
MRFHALSSFSIFIGLISPAISSPLYSHAIRAAKSSPTLTSIHEFTPGTWVENLAVRANGQILATLVTTPQVYQVDPDPSAAHPLTLVHTFPNYLSCVGITELGDDIFYVVTGNFSIPAGGSTPGSYSVWKLDMAGFTAGGAPANATKVADFPQSVNLNGMTALNSDGNTLLIADAGAGAVWSLKVDTGAVEKAITDPLMAPTSNAALPIGINGVKVRDQSLYFTSTDQALVGKVDLNADGSAKGPAVTVSGNASSVDDFQIDTLGDMFIAGNDELRFRGASDSSSSALVVVSNSSLLVGSTAAEFGRLSSDLGSLYVTTNGGSDQYVSQQYTNPGRIVKVDVSAAGWT